MKTCKGCLDSVLAIQQTKDIPKTQTIPPTIVPTDPPATDVKVEKN